MIANWGSQDLAEFEGGSRGDGREAGGFPPDQECRADERGEFRFTGLVGPEFLRGMKADWLLEARTDALGPANGFMIVPRFLGPEVSGVELRVVPERAVSGVVFDPSGAPLAEAVVTVRETVWSPGAGSEVRGASYEPPPACRARFLTDAAGAFRIPALPAGKWSLDVYAEGFLGATVQAREEEPVTVRMKSEQESGKVALEGRVLDPAGQPVVGAKVLYARWTSQMAETDAAGWFRIEGLDPKRMGSALTVYAPGFALGGTVPKAVDGRVLQVEIALEAELRIQGRVLGKGGTPRAGVDLILSVHEEPGVDLPYWKANWPHQAFGLSQVASDGEGGFEFTALWPGEWDLRAVEEGRRGTQTLALRTVTAGEPGVVLQLGAGLSDFAGLVVDSVSGEPIRGYFVHPGKHTGHSSSYDMQRRQWIDEEDGGFRFLGLEQGAWSFVLEAEGFVREETLTFELPRSGEPPVFRLGKPVDIDLRVWDSRGERVHLAFLDALGLNGDPLATQSIEPLGATDHGETTLEGLPLGEIVLLVSPPGSFEEFEFPVDLRQGFEDGLDLDLPADFSSPRQAVAVELRTPEGRPLERSFSLRAVDGEGDVVAHWRVGFWRDEFRITPGHDLMVLIKPLPASADSVVPLELPPGRFLLTVLGDGWEQPGPEVLVRSDLPPEGVTIVVAAEG
ncbi:MAG: carboxypeptidase regulatory-like domain-containing protein [Planctomycetes bacterium]|nr:carboxypeptidase regulatory-like domain-containing protein [Planctomycetota bacterium]